MAQAKKTAKKKSSAKTKKAASPSTRTQKKVTPPPPPAPPAGDGNRGPVLILIIMLLVATVAFLLNRQYSGKIRLPFPKKDNAGITSDRSEEKKKQQDSEKKPADKKDDSKNADRQKDTGRDEPAQRDVQIYLVSYNEKTEAVSLKPVRRTVSGASPLDAALHELLKGPSSSEKKKGMITAIPSGLRIRSVAMRDGIADIDFNERLEEGGAGNILLSRVDQIVYTATQFDSVKGVTIRVNGKKKKTLGADGLSVDGPLHRRR